MTKCKLNRNRYFEGQSTNCRLFKYQFYRHKKIAEILQKKLLKLFNLFKIILDVMKINPN